MIIEDKAVNRHPEFLGGSQNMEVFQKINDGQDLSKEDLIFLLSIKKCEDLTLLYNQADKYRKKYVGDEVHLRGLIEFSNFCRKNCIYCGIRRDNGKIKRYRMSAEEILDSVALAENLGYRTVVLQSGEDLFFTAEMISDLIKQIKRHSDVAITLSIGERRHEELKRLYDAGADRFLLRFETSNRELYSKLHPDSNYDNRMENLSFLKEIGYQVGSGIMIGLPNQTVTDLAMDILKFKELDLDMVGVGPYISHPDTPLAGHANGTAEMTFKVIALTRIVTGYAYIPATTALATIRQADGREKALQLGANVVMPNVTPTRYRADYEIYPNKACIRESAEQCRTCLHKRINSLGRPISQEYGHSLRSR